MTIQHVFLTNHVSSRELNKRILKLWKSERWTVGEIRAGLEWNGFCDFTLKSKNRMKTGKDGFRHGIFFWNSVNLIERMGEISFKIGKGWGFRKKTLFWESRLRRPFLKYLIVILSAVDVSIIIVAVFMRYSFAYFWINMWTRIFWPVDVTFSFLTFFSLPTSALVFDPDVTI